MFKIWQPFNRNAVRNLPDYSGSQRKNYDAAVRIDLGSKVMYSRGKHD